jgi:hypothetical protein
MSDTDDGWRRPDPTAPVAAPPPPPAWGAPQQPTYGAPTVPPPPPAAIAVEPAEAPQNGRSSQRLLVGVACVAAVALLVTALVLVRRAGSERAGAESPEAAADGLFAALENEDLVALAELLHPGERRTLAEPAFEIVDELVRLELLDPSIDLAGLNGVDVTIEGLQYRLEPVPGGDDLREVVIESGTISASTNGEELPIGPTLRERFGDQLGDLDSDETTEFDQSTNGEIGPILVEYDGRWYFSLWYTVAEGARRFAGIETVPTLAEVPPAIGADSPEAAIDATIDAASGLDLRSIIGMLDPEETAALYRYAPLFLDEAQAEIDDVLAEFDASDIRWSVSEIEYTTETEGDVGYVTVNSFTANVQAEGITVDLTYAPTAVSVDVVYEGAEYRVDVAIADNTISADGVLDGEPLSAQVTFADDSVTGWAEFEGSRFDGTLTIDPEGVCSPYEVSVDGETESGCLEDEAGDDGAEALALALSQFDDFTLPTPTLVTTRTDGKWYFSPLLTVSHAILSYLRSTDADTLARQIDQFEEFMGGGF